MGLSKAQYIDRIYPEDLVKKSDAWCKDMMVGATEGALRKRPKRVKEVMKRRVLGLPYRTHSQHAYYVKLGHGVAVGNWTNGLTAKRILQQAGYGSTPGEVTEASRRLAAEGATSVG